MKGITTVRRQKDLSSNKCSVIAVIIASVMALTGGCEHIAPAGRSGIQLTTPPVETVTPAHPDKTNTYEMPPLPAQVTMTSPLLAPETEINGIKVDDMLGEWVITENHLEMRIISNRTYELFPQYEGIEIIFGSDYIQFGDTQYDEIYYEIHESRTPDYFGSSVNNRIWAYGMEVYTDAKAVIVCGHDMGRGIFAGTFEDGNLKLYGEITVMSADRIYMEWSGIFFELVRK